MNIELLKKIAAHARLRPKTLNMGDWLTKVEVDADHPCGTTGCIAGWALFLGAPGDLDPLDTVKIGQDIAPLQRGGWRAPAARLLDLTDEEAERLFFCENWPELYVHELDAITDVPGEGEGEVVARRIERFIETEGRE